TMQMLPSFLLKLAAACLCVDTVPLVP
ncbi:proline racemase family protein, partial [Vibrio parahaemolyticus V-223/04]